MKYYVNTRHHPETNVRKLGTELHLANELANQHTAKLLTIQR